jgi:uncharacterized protein YcbK (DUF882 family)
MTRNIKYILAGVLIYFILTKKKKTINTKTHPVAEFFLLSDFHSKDGVQVPVEYYDNLQKLMDNLDVLRRYLNAPILINSGYRSPAHNRSVGGKKDSQHLYGKAADIRSNTFKPREIAAAIEKLIKEGKMLQGGLGIYPTFIHYDIRGTKARW